MVFSSLLFLFLFLPIVLILHTIVPNVYAKNTVLFLFSLVFYAWGEPIYILLMLFSTVLDYSCGLGIDYWKKKGNISLTKLFLLVSIITNLGLLGFFKYSGLDLPLPIGISFYTFQTMSYTIDVYLGKTQVQKNIVSFGAYVTLFPQLIAGPIVRYDTVAKELNDRKVTISLFLEGIYQFVIGLGKKVLLANQIGSLWEIYQVRLGEELSFAGAWLGMTAFAFQIYFDFSGYSDMAIGLGKMLGFYFPENFRYPYQAKTITDFWRRWHISLSTWFKEYVYIPLGGNKKGLTRQVINIMIVWLLTGIWHGASLNFLYWGLYFGVLLLVEKLFLRKYLEQLPSVIQHSYSLFFVWIGWVLFAFEKESNIVVYIKSMFHFGNHSWITQFDKYQWENYGILLCILMIGCTSYPKKLWNYIRDKFQKQSGIFFFIETLFYIGIFLLSVAYLVDATYNPFLYFRF